MLSRESSMFTEWIPLLYPNEVKIRQDDKRQSNESCFEKYTAFLEKLRVDTNIKYSHFQDIPAKSSNFSKINCWCLSSIKKRSFWVQSHRDLLNLISCKRGMEINTSGLLGCRYKANCPLVGPGHIWSVTSVGVFLSDPSLSLREFRRKLR